MLHVGQEQDKFFYAIETLHDEKRLYSSLNHLEFTAGHWTCTKKVILSQLLCCPTQVIKTYVFSSFFFFLLFCLKIWLYCLVQNWKCEESKQRYILIKVLLPLSPVLLNKVHLEFQLNCKNGIWFLFGNNCPKFSNPHTVLVRLNVPLQATFAKHILCSFFSYQSG